MKKLLNISTAAMKVGFAAKGFIDIAISPLKSVRDFIKKMLIKSMVVVIKKGINLSLKDKNNTDSNIVIKQLNALTDSNADTSGISKNIKFNMTLDSLIEEANTVDEYKILKFIDLTKAKNKISEYKNSLRKDAYEYISENSFENMTTLVHAVNEIINMPTEIVGCELIKCKVTVESHDEIKHDFWLLFDVDFCVKSKN